MAGILLVIGLVGTVAPWHRAGPLTGMFSAWRPGPQPWPLVACLGLIAAAAPTLGALLFATRRVRRAALAYTVLAVLTVAAAAVALAAAPDYTSPTAAPFVVLAAATLVAAVGVVRVRRLSP